MDARAEHRLWQRAALKLLAAKSELEAIPREREVLGRRANHEELAARHDQAADRFDEASFTLATLLGKTYDEARAGTISAITEAAWAANPVEPPTRTAPPPLRPLPALDDLQEASWAARRLPRL